ncbi:MAG: histidinol dehydrogenase [Flavobacteriales bacterium]|nr:MAG: histidinol dehydrogenase [Flavobacteriales bacterium]
MEVFKKIKTESWEALSSRPKIDDNDLNQTVLSILDNVKQNGDEALTAYAKKFDKADLNEFLVTETEIRIANKLVSEELKQAINIAKQNIEKFHNSQFVEEEVVETTSGVECWRRSVGIEKVGLYIPGGSAPLFSTVLMLGIPAKLASCKEIVLCTPCNETGEINPAILYTANLIGINKIYKVGGAQAIAAMAYGTKTIPQVYKIFGPGNQFVTKAKELVQQNGIAIDMPAGPSEVLIIADKTGNPAYIAADLLSQAEHGEDSQVILLTDNENLLNRTLIELNKQLVELPRVEIAKKALLNSKAVLLNNIDECIAFSNLYAPEHLIIASNSSSDYIDSIVNAGSVFLGNYSCESAGDYASGTNHTLPTNGYARNYSGVSLESFQKKITFQKINKEGLKTIGPSIEIMAEAEELYAHKNAVTVRLKDITNV